MFIRFHARRWSEEDLAKRLCQLMYGKDDVWREEQGSTHRWNIGICNDFWLHPEGGEIFRVHYRYGTPEKQQALAVMLEWRLDVKLLPEHP